MPPIKVFKPPIGYSKAADTPREQKKEFFSSWAEWAAQNKEMIIRSTSSTANATIYTVPDGQTLFITEAHVAVTSGSINNSSLTIYVRSTGETLLGVSARLKSEGAVSLSFRTPVRVEGGEIIATSVSQPSIVSAGFVGFLVNF